MFRMKINPLLIAIPLILISVISILLLGRDSRLPGLNTSSPWFRAGLEALENSRDRRINNSAGAAKNIILFIGDGMSMTTVTAARIFAGQRAGLDGEEHTLSFEQFPWSGLSRTYNSNQQTADSAGTMTAMITGIKTRAGVLSIREEVERASCENYLGTANADLITALELAEIAGKATGIVSTARLTHATPAATYAKSPERNWEATTTPNDEDLPNGCQDIASQLIGFADRLRNSLNATNTEIDGIDLAFGGGRSMFYAEDPENLVGFAEATEEGAREDGRNLIREWINQGGIYVMDQSSFDLLSNEENRNILGLFDSSHMHYEADRHNDEAGEPSLTEMTVKAIDTLEQDSDGFFLLVEAGRIDHAHHDSNAYNALNETVELSNAVAAALAATDDNETLIIVTADHSHVMTMAGYPTRGNPILGKVISNDSAGAPQTEYALDSNELPYTTLNYMNGRGFADLSQRTDGNYPTLELEQDEDPPSLPGRVDLSNVNTEAPGFHQEAFIPLRGGETHGGEDVPIYASGPGAHLLSGSVEQNVIFHVMNFAGNLQQLAEGALE